MSVGELLKIEKKVKDVLTKLGAEYPGLQQLRGAVTGRRDYNESQCSPFVYRMSGLTSF